MDRIVAWTEEGRGGAVNDKFFVCVSENSIISPIDFALIVNFESLFFIMITIFLRQFLFLLLLGHVYAS